MSKDFGLKGFRNRLCAVFQLPATSPKRRVEIKQYREISEGIIFMRIISTHGPRFAALLLLLPALAFIASLFVDFSAMAQEQVFVYQGELFNNTGTCNVTYTCVPGSVSGSVTVSGMPSGYSGSVYPGQYMTVEDLTANGLTPTLHINKSGGTNDLYMTSGALTGWQLILLP